MLQRHRLSQNKKATDGRATGNKIVAETFKGKEIKRQEEREDEKVRKAAFRTENGVFIKVRGAEPQSSTEEGGHEKCDWVMDYVSEFGYLRF